MREMIVKVLVNAIGCDENDLQDDTVLTEVPGFDSLKFVMTISELQESYGIDVPLDKAIEVKTVGELVSCVRKK